MRRKMEQDTKKTEDRERQQEERRKYEDKKYNTGDRMTGLATQNRTGDKKKKAKRTRRRLIP